MTMSLLVLLFLLTQYFSSIAGVLGPSECNRCLYGTVSNCYGKIYNRQEFTCCEGHLHKGAGLSCCSGKAFNPDKATCCFDVTGRRGNLTSLSQFVSECCGGIAYNPLNQLCCGAKLLSKTVAHAECCGGVVLDPDRQMCCSSLGRETVLTRATERSLCCGDNQYNPSTQCCCWNKTTDRLERHNLTDSSPCCKEEQHPTPAICQSEVIDPESKMCCGPHGRETVLTRETKYHRCCGNTQYNPLTHCCCFNNEKVVLETENRTETSHCCKDEDPLPASFKAKVSLQDGYLAFEVPDNPICCDGQKYRQRPRTNQRTDWFMPEQCSPSFKLYRPPDHTVCGSFYHDSPGQHCCGENIYRPETDICCNGISHPRRMNSHCCGVKPYNASDDQVKCCQRTLYNLTQLGKVGRQVQCCNNILMDNKSSICCQGLTYSIQQGFSCCGENYYNTSLWSCCAGELYPVPETKHRSKREVHKETKLEQLESLNTIQICERVFIGTVVSVSVGTKNNSRLIVMTNVLHFNGRKGLVEIRTSPHILQLVNHCSSDVLELGKTYLWDADPPQFFSELHQFNLLYSLHLVLSKCKKS